MSELAGSIVRAGDEGVARRLKALACTAPLHDLDARKGLQDWVDGSRYQMAEIGLQAIDQVTLAMDFDHGADADQVVRRLLPFVAAQSPGSPAAEHERVGHWVIENLINIGSLDRGFAVHYGSIDARGRYVRRRFDFKLLVEVAAPDGAVYLRASDEAINVLVGALDTVVESAQVAAEVKLENLISRGRLGDARLAAEQARYRTVQYAEALRAKLEATRRDVRSVDWLEAVPALLDEALTHIEGRYRAETAILANIADARDEATEPDRRRQAAELVGVVDDCIQRHTQLQARLQEAGAAFRAEQDRQQFAGRPQRAAIDVFGQLLRPCLGLPVGMAADPAAAFFAAGTGIRVPSVPSLGGLVETLLTPPAERDPLGQELPEPNLAPSEPDRFGDRCWAEADALLPGGPGGTAVRLSDLLAHARESSGSRGGAAAGSRGDAPPSNGAAGGPGGGAAPGGGSRGGAVPFGGVAPPGEARDPAAAASAGEPHDRGADELATLVALRALHAVGTAVGTARTQGDDALLVAVDDGTVLRDGDFAGADLLLARAAVDAS